MESTANMNASNLYIFNIKDVAFNFSCAHTVILNFTLFSFTRLLRFSWLGLNSRMTFLCLNK